MGDQKMRATRYSSVVIADLLMHFEHGKGFISRSGFKAIREKHGLTDKKIQYWAYKRRLIHGVYGEKIVFKKFRDFCRCPSFDRLVDCYSLLVDFIMTWIRINGFN